MASHWVVCVKCGRKFDESEETAYYDEKSRRYTCLYCHLREYEEKEKAAELAKSRAAAQSAAHVSQKSRTVALIICVFVGFLGIHHFYSGRNGLGVLYLLTAGLCGIGWIIDIVLIATGKYKDGKGLLIAK